MKPLTIIRSGVVAPVNIDPTGIAGPKQGTARGPRYRRSGRNLYVPASVDPTATDQRIVEAIADAPEGAAVTGWAALSWLRTLWFDGLLRDGQTTRPVPIALGDRPARSPRPGVTYSNDWLFDDDVIVVDGLPITTPLRSATYEARRARDIVRAVTVLDMAMAGDLFDTEELREYVARLAYREGVVLLKDSLPFVNENVWSPKEDVQRLTWLFDRDADLACNCPIFDLSGRHLFTPDLLDLVAGVTGEYNGIVHESMPVRRRDLHKEELMRRHRIEGAAMMSTDLRDTVRFIERLNSAYVRAEDHAGRPRTWTVEQPDWWVDTSTVARRRALTEDERAQWHPQRRHLRRP